MAEPSSSKSHSFQAPKGTRDMYPADLLKRRYIEKMWRDTAIRHGFEEIDGPTFEHLELYTVKSGEGIVSELFSFRREGGEKDYALRPEFTPTLARMYAAKAGGLPKPTKWFWQQNCFRAEKPQRGRLREFGQWNVDLIGGESEPEAQARVDAEVISCAIAAFALLGLGPADVQIRIGSRELAGAALLRAGVMPERLPEALVLLDKADRMDPVVHQKACADIGFDIIAYRGEAGKIEEGFDLRTSDVDQAGGTAPSNTYDFRGMRALRSELQSLGAAPWCRLDLSIARGLAYYTGTVFEVHEAGGKERAIAGGGRYDKLIEMFGGPPTPAVGFGMGDVVLSLVLEDRGLMPQGQALLDKLSEPPASMRPDVFVISNGQPESDAAVRPLVAGLRRGGRGGRGEASESRRGGNRVPPLHARHSYKATKNIGKLLQEASAVHARFAAIVENASEATLKNLATQEQEKVRVEDIGARVATSLQ
jgi:histidyl-tRNA synthetase